MEGSTKKPPISPKANQKKWTRDDTALTLLALPTILWFLVFSYLPMPGIIMAFKNYKPIAGQTFYQNLFGSAWAANHGLANFQFLFRTPNAKIMLTNTVLYNIIFIILSAVLPVLFAIMLSEIYSKTLSKTTQTAIFLPHFLSWVIVGFFLFAFLSDARGFFNQILKVMGKEPIGWYNEPKYWRGIIIFMNQWKGIGYNSVIYLAAITGIDQSLYEAAVLDGASKWEQAIHITIPFIRPIVIVLFIMAVGRIFNSDFGLFWNVPRQSPSLYDQWTTLDTYIFQSLKGSSPSGLRLGAAAGFFQSFFGFITIMIANMVVKKVDEGSALF